MAEDKRTNAIPIRHCLLVCLLCSFVLWALMIYGHMKHQPCFEEFELRRQVIYIPLNSNKVYKGLTAAIVLSFCKNDPLLFFLSTPF